MSRRSPIVRGSSDKYTVCYELRLFAYELTWLMIGLLCFGVFPTLTLVELGEVLDCFLLLDTDLDVDLDQCDILRC